MTALHLNSEERALLDGRDGPAARWAMEVIVRMAVWSGAERLVPITCAHVDGCLYHGTASLDFAERLQSLEARVRVPTTLNVGALDLLHPELFRGDAETATRARRLMDLYVAMGCEPTWTCAPYQLPRRPAHGEQIAWAESNAIVFANSVLGARTDRYGDFVDILAAVAGRVPLAGLHRDDARPATIEFRMSGVAPELLAEDAAYPLIGHMVGELTGNAVPVLTGLPDGLSEHRLKAIGAAAASSGAVAMFHAVGSTPEAPTVGAACGGTSPARVVEVDGAMLRAARDRLSAAADGEITAVSIGTPHFSLEEFRELADLVRDDDDFAVDFYVSTGRATLAELERTGEAARLRGTGIEIVVDTCTYVTPILRRTDGAVMTNSAKWAFYAPANLGVAPVFGSLKECVQSARLGRVWRDDRLWVGTGGARPTRAGYGPLAAHDVASSGVPRSSREHTAALHVRGLATRAATLVGPELRDVVSDQLLADALVLTEPISLWGGVDAQTGSIIEARHPQFGESVRGRLLVMPGGRGSSSSSSILAEMVRAGTAPAAILLLRPDPILALGSLVAEALYSRTVPVALA